jgi:prepilin-type N-terminal cleavage/methylation domain-containing protein
MSSSKRPLRSAGFTLIEVMVALVISAILAGVIFQLVRGQGRFVSVQNAREEVQQNARGALEIISSELRTIHPSGLATAQKNAVSFRLPRAWGISCGNTANTSLTAVFPAALPAGMTALAGISGIMGDVTGVGPGNAYAPTPASGTVQTVTGRAVVNLELAGNACSGLRPVGPSAEVVALTFTGTNLPVVTQGNRVYLYQTVTYDVSQSGGHFWINRNGQPLAGPLVTSDSGLVFNYWQNAGNTRLSAPVAAADLPTVGRVAVSVRTKSRGRGGPTQYATDSMTVLLWNRP